MIRIFLVDDHPFVRRGLSAEINLTADLTVAGEAGTGAQALALARQLQPDVILLDLNLPDAHGLDLLPQLLAAAPAARVVVFTSFLDDALAVAALKAGAAGYLLKDAPPAEVLAGLRAAQAGRPVLAAAVERQLIHQLRQPAPAEPLSQRELEVLRAMARGLSNGEIAEKLVISEGTVRSHVSRLLAKLGLTNRAQAVVYAIRQHLVDPDDLLAPGAG